MPLTWLPYIRVILLIAAVTAVLQATVLNRLIQRTVFDRWIAFGARIGQPMPARPFPDPRLARAFPLLMALVFLAVWWFLGTADGVSWAVSHLGRHP